MLHKKSYKKCDRRENDCINIHKPEPKHDRLSAWLKPAKNIQR